MNWKERADAILNQTESPDLGDELSALHLALVNERLDLEGLRGKVWMVMPYRCDRCGRVEWYEAEVGVEGPPDWRADGTYIASAFTAGRCPRDGEPLTHMMHNDLSGSGTLEPGKPFVSKFTLTTTYASRMFRVPSKPVQYVTEGCDDNGHVIYSTATHAFLSTPMHAIRRAMHLREAEPFA